ncbi:hypothetical protein QT711_00080 [Sporosarcina saromensis]|uniref:Uncharacterized protein n=1 Tax=Sporosarcina saromensis TaxID=359365 RepID=A0ABU4G3L6_9BACL|nr:hypothetical protein [Sporosarcina saromensis]MDW0111559.1 hypothetical protein [Sporosarcina saromensis]
MEYWELIENPKDETYRQLMKVLTRNSDKFYFITRRELNYNQEILAHFAPFTLETYKTKKWANTITKGPAATVYVIESNEETYKLLTTFANTLYDWVAPNLPEDITFMKNNFAWFSCTTHEAFGGFTFRSDYYKNLLCEIPGLKVQQIE